MNEKDPFVRINSRVREDQIDFIKRFTKKNSLKLTTEGEVHRHIIDFFMSKHKDMVDIKPKP